VVLKLLDALLGKCAVLRAEGKKIAFDFSEHWFPFCKETFIVLSGAEQPREVRTLVDMMLDRWRDKKYLPDKEMRSLVECVRNTKSLGRSPPRRPKNAPYELERDIRTSRAIPDRGRDRSSSERDRDRDRNYRDRDRNRDYDRDRDRERNRDRDYRDRSSTRYREWGRGRDGSSFRDHDRYSPGRRTRSRSPARQRSHSETPSFPRGRSPPPRRRSRSPPRSRIIGDRNNSGAGKKGKDGLTRSQKKRKRKNRNKTMRDGSAMNENGKKKEAKETDRTDTAEMEASLEDCLDFDE